MRADVADIRKRNGSDRWDEMWEGELHMPPSPNLHHQDFEWSLETYLRVFWASAMGGRVFHQANVAGPGMWTENYRIPDIVLLTPERLSINKNDYLDGGPDVVVEIKSPGDESHAKLPFYASIGVREVWIIDRDSKEPEIYALAGAELIQQPASAEGWHQSAVTGMEMRSDGQGKLRIRRGDDPSSERSLPE